MPLALGLALGALPAGDLHASWPQTPLTAAISPELARAAALAPGETFSVWVGLADKGESGAQDLAARLARAEAGLTPRARARRMRAGVRPLVDYLDLPVEAGYVAELARRGLQPHGASRWLNQVAVRMPGTRLSELAALPFVSRLGPVERGRLSPDLGGEGAIESAGPGRAAPARQAAVDYGRLGGTGGPIEQIGLHLVHEAGWTGRGILVALLDGGFNYHHRHEALRDVPVPPGFARDFVRGLMTAQDTTSNLVSMRRGTWSLGLVAGRLPGAYVGAAYEADVALALTEVGTSQTAQEMIYWAQGAEWADSLGADIISTSLGFATFDGGAGNYVYEDMDGRTTIVSQAAQIAAAKGILLVSAVGDQGQTFWQWLVAPADVHGDSLIAVGAVNAAGAPAAFSSYGPSADGRVKPDVAARGVSTPVCDVAPSPLTYSSLNGSAFAASLVTGLAACLMQARPLWQPRDVARAIRLSANNVQTPNPRVGYGIPWGPYALDFDPASFPSQPAPFSLQLLSRNPMVGGSMTFAASGIPCTDSLGYRGAVLTIHDGQGRRVAEVAASAKCRRPWVPVVWDGRDDRGARVRPGIYFASLRSEGRKATVRFVCLR